VKERCEGVEMRLWVGSLDDYDDGKHVHYRELAFPTGPTERLQLEAPTSSPSVKTV